MLRHLCVKHLLPHLCWALSVLKCWFFLKWVSLLVPTLEKDGSFSTRTPLQKWGSDAQTRAVFRCSKGTTLLLDGASSVLFLGEASQASHLPGSMSLSRTWSWQRVGDDRAATAGPQLYEPVCVWLISTRPLLSCTWCSALSPSLFWLAAHLR